jgi:hypothetical protein
MTRISLALCLALAGCGNTAHDCAPDLGVHDAGSPDLSTPDLAVDVKGHPLGLQLSFAGGPLLKSPEIYTVVWQGDEARATDIDRFVNAMLASDYWGVLKQYNVGAGVSKGALVVPGATLPTDLSDPVLNQLVEANVASGAWPQPNDNTLFMLVLPPSAKSSWDNGTGLLTACTDYLGYHNSTPNTNQAYAVIPSCLADESLFHYSAVISHELAEAATDPAPFAKPAWNVHDAMPGFEVGDLCELGASSQVTLDFGADDGGAPERYLVQRLFSEEVAASGNGDPCVPAQQLYVGAAMGEVTLDANLQAVAELKLFADRDVGDIYWSSNAPGLLTPANGVGRAGDVVKVAIDGTTFTRPVLLPIYVNAPTAPASNSWWVLIRPSHN